MKLSVAALAKANQMMNEVMSMPHSSKYFDEFLFNAKDALIEARSESIEIYFHVYHFKDGKLNRQGVSDMEVMPANTDTHKLALKLATDSKCVVTFLNQIFLVEFDKVTRIDDDELEAMF
jgi:hypothetical protein